MAKQPRTTVESNDPADHAEPTPTVVDLAREFFRREHGAAHKQREREADDLKFQISDPEHQWDSHAIAARSAQTVAGQSIPPRPMLCVDTLTEPIELVLGQMRSAHLGIQIHPLTEDASDDTAEVFQGLYRNIEVCSRAHLARMWAYDRGVKCGRGVYRVRTEYDPESSTPGDQRIVIDRILYQDAVYLDSFAQQPDWSDGDEAMIVEAMPLAKYKRTYPKSKVADFDNDAFLEAVGSWPEWFNEPEGAQVVVVGEYYRITYEKEEFDVTNWKTKATTKAERIKRVLHYSKVNGCEELEPEEIIPGQYIPLIPYIGRELQPVDGDRHYVGMIRPAKDGARLTNYAASGAVEMAALEPRAPWMMEEGQDEGYKKLWEQSNIVNFPVLKYKRIGLSGMPGAPPQRVQVDQSRLGPNMQLLSMGQDFVQKATATYDPALGQQPTAHRSGRALIALQDQTTEATGGYLGNLSEITLPYEARVILDLIPHYYDRPERIATILDENKKPSRVMLNAPFTMEQNRPQPLPYETDDQKRSTDAMVRNPEHAAKHYDLSKGRYGVSVTVGKSTASRLQAGSDALSSILESDPSLMPLIGPEWIRFQDFPGAKAVETILRKVRENQFPFLKDQQANDPQQMQQALEQSKQQMQQLMQEFQQAQATINGKKIEAQNKFEIEQMKADIELQRDRIKAETAIAVAEINKRQDVFKEERERIGLQLDAARAVSHEAHQAAQDRQHEATEGAKVRAHEATMSALEHVQTLEQTAHEAALAPQPLDESASQA